MQAPPEVRAAIQHFQPKPGLELKPSKPSETSVIFNWGVRLESITDPGVLYWLCLGSESCRARPAAIRLSVGKTSKATKHLKEVHGVESERTQLLGQRLPPLDSDHVPQPTAEARAINVANHIAPGSTQLFRAEPPLHLPRAVAPEPPAIETPAAPEPPTPAPEVEKPPPIPVPPEVKAAIERYVPETGFELLPPKTNESSFIFDWGVRVQPIGNSIGANQTAWICLASDECRSQTTMARLYSGRTSRATRHLKEVHGIVSGKVSAEATAALPPVPITETTTPVSAVAAGTRTLSLLSDAASVEQETIPPLSLPPSVREVAGLSAMRVFLAVKAAIDSYVPEEGFVVMPAKPSERSIIFYWGVRVQAIAANGAGVVAWVCLASENCRARTTAFRLFSGKTSKATKHLKEIHGIAYEYTNTAVTDEEEARAAAVDGAFNVHGEEILAEGEFVDAPTEPEVEDPRAPENLLAVKAAIKDYTVPNTETFVLKPPTAAERSVIYEWGVRVHCVLEDRSDRLAWICLASESCRATLTCVFLSGGKTSKATKHLRDVHGIIAEQPRLEVCAADEANDANAGEEGGGAEGDEAHPPEHIELPPRPVVRLPTTRIPLTVKAAIESFVPGPRFVTKLVGKAESSIINDWGVRVETISNGEVQFGWICLASAKCQEQRVYTHLSGGKTSKATKHLKDAHGISAETSAAAYERNERTNRKRRRCEDSDLLRNSDLFYDDPGRMFVLLQTLRIVNSTLPYSHGEYPESLVLRDLAATATTPLPAFNAKVAAHCTVELFASVRQEIVEYLGVNRLPANVKSLSIAANIWSSSKMPKDTKILGLRLYFVDTQWEIKSVLLSTRFVPSSSCAIESLHKWMFHVLRDFGLQPSDLLHATTHGRKHEVKWAVQNSLSLPWNWCMLDLTNDAITKACGMVNDATRSKNLAMTQLIGRLAITVYQVKHEPVLSMLFAHLCEWLGNGIDEQLLDYQTHRFVGFTAFLQRVLEYWDALETWYDDRTVQARRTRTTAHGATGSVPSFPLARDKDDLIQVFSMLEPITAIARKSQKLDECPTQVDVLTALFQLRLSALDVTKPLRQCRIVKASHAIGSGGALPRYATPPPPANQVTYFVPTLSLLAANTRVLLRDALHDNFFARYTTSTSPIAVHDTKVSWLPEMQLLLHPAFKNFDDGLLKKVVVACNTQRGVAAATIESIFDAIKTKVQQQILEMMRSVASVQDDATVSSDPVEADDSTRQGEEEQQQQQASSQETEKETRNPDHNAESAQCPYEAELERWLTSDTTVLARSADNTGTESVLAFWRRQWECKQYKFLPLVARVVFSVPACTTQLERDFGVSERMLVSQRSRFTNSNDSNDVNGDQFHRVAAMNAFLNRNRDFVDVTQCAALPPTTQALDDNTPANLRVDLARAAQRDDVLTLDSVLSACYAATSAFNDEAYFY
ncbi:hypothetical protein FI667_g4031, partial [Globisporangium splendens]